MPSALDGIKVLDMTDGMAGALAIMFLCDNGARVIRIEMPANGAPRTNPATASGIGAKRKRPTRSQPSYGRSGSDQLYAFHRLVRGADVLVESLPPSSSFHVLVDYDTLSSLNRRLVHCSIIAYGKHGPPKDEHTNDDLVMAWTGVLLRASRRFGRCRSTSSFAFPAS